MKSAMKVFLAAIFLSGALNYEAFGQQNSKETLSNDSLTYKGEMFYTPNIVEPVPFTKVPTNVIFLIGDGMGFSHVTAAKVANQGKLYLDWMPVTGMSTTHSANEFVTDSGAGGTALATGKKSYNGAIGVGADSSRITNIREIMSLEGKSTGVVVTCDVTHATPAAFVAHQLHRDMRSEIAVDFTTSNIDLFMGGGLKYFTSGNDSINLLKTLSSEGYYIDTQTVTANPTVNLPDYRSGQKFAGLYASEHMERVTAGRGDYLPEATKKAIEYLSNNPLGFFLMIEGSQIDWGAHANVTEYFVAEALDFDKAVGEALKFAAKSGNTLVVVTADHETGGVALPAGSYETGMVKANYTTKDHTGAMVPVFAYGPGAELFGGIMDNTDIPVRILKALEISP